MARATGSSVISNGNSGDADVIVLVKYSFSFIEPSSFGKLHFFVHRIRKTSDAGYEIEFVVNTFTYCYLYI